MQFHVLTTLVAVVLSYILPTPAQALGHGRFICCAARAAPHGPPWPSSARFNIYRYGGTEKFHCGAQTLLLLSIIHVPNTFFYSFRHNCVRGRGPRHTPQDHPKLGSSLSDFSFTVIEKESLYTVRLVLWQCVLSTCVGLPGSALAVVTSALQAWPRRDRERLSLMAWPPPRGHREATLIISFSQPSVTSSPPARPAPASRLWGPGVSLSQTH